MASNHAEPGLLERTSASSELGDQWRRLTRVATAMAALEPYQRAGYATTRCSAGTELDLHPETPAFPTEWPLAPPGVPAV